MSEIPGKGNLILDAEETVVVREATDVLKRMEEKQKALIEARDSLSLQLNGISNQLFLIDQLLHPEPPEPDPDVHPAPPPDGYV